MNDFNTTCRNCGKSTDKHYRVTASRESGDYYRYQESVEIYVCETSVYDSIGYRDQEDPE